jgi:hypothetical protein
VAGRTHIAVPLVEDRMKARYCSGLAVVGLVLIACGGGKPVEINPDAQSVASRWNAVLSTPPELGGVADIRGQGWVAADPKNQGQIIAHVSISNSVPNAVHPWHVHRGECGSDQGIAGPADAYQPLKVKDDGRAESTANLATSLPRSGRYFINVHASSKNMSTIVACGNLAPPSQ